jgi:hypothetical protein
VLSLMSGDTRRSLQQSSRIVVFKVLYYLFALRTWRQSRQWWLDTQVTLRG